MRLSVVFSLLLGLLALLAIVQRVPIDEHDTAPVAKPAPVAAAIDTRVGQDALPRVRTRPPRPADNGRLYRWRDPGGAIHFQTDPPPADVQAQVIPFVRRQSVAVPALAPQPVDTAPDILDALPAALSVYTPAGFDELLQQVEETAVKLRDRNEYLETLEKQL